MLTVALGAQRHTETHRDTQRHTETHMGTRVQPRFSSASLSAERTVGLWTEFRVCVSPCLRVSVPVCLCLCVYRRSYWEKRYAPFANKPRRGLPLRARAPPEHPRRGWVAHHGANLPLERLTKRGPPRQSCRSRGLLRAASAGSAALPHGALVRWEAAARSCCLRARRRRHQAVVLPLL
jgi:hypothetical protein